MTQLLEAKHLSRHFGERHALRDLSFTLDAGEVLGFLGPNGAGKSTCLRILTGNLTADAGSVRIAGIDIAEHPVRAKAHIGYLPEHPPLYLNQKVDEYLRYAARLHGVRRAKLTGALALAKRRCGLEAVGGRLIGKLSKGYRQRVGIAQAIVHQPDLIILDEPSVGLDPAQTRDIRELVRELGRDKAVLMSTHLLPEAQATCSRVLMLRNGSLAHQAKLRNGQSDDGRRRLLLALQHAPELAALRALPGVDSASRRRDGRFELQLDEHAEVAEIARQCALADWGLRELTPLRQDLEHTFMRLTSSESEDKTP